jgi:hypothetical protein
MPTCTRTGCGKEFDENSNNEGDCLFHPGGIYSLYKRLSWAAPIFHEGLKGIITEIALVADR